MELDDQQLAQRFAAMAPQARKAFLSRLKASGLSFAELPIVPARRPGPVPLSHAQRSLWLTWTLASESPAYNMPGVLGIQGGLDVAALERALRALAGRHETLRTIFPSDEHGEANQVCLEPPLVALEVRPVENPDDLPRLVLDFAALPFKLDTELPFRVLLWRVAEERHALGMVVHHIACDGASVGILLDEILALYEQESRGQAGALGALPIQFADYALWQRSWFEAGEHERQLDYWRERLEEHPAALELPFDRPRGGAAAKGEGRHQVSLPAGLSGELRRLAHAQGASVFMAMLALFNLLLHRFSGQSDLCVGSPVANRQRLETQGMVGYLTNVLVLRSRLDLSQNYSQLLRAVRQTVLDAHAHPDLPFDLLVEALKPERRPGVHPLFQVKCTQQQDVAARRRVAGLEVDIEALSGGEAHFDLSLDFVDRPDGIAITFCYAQALFDTASVARFAQAFVELAEAVARQPDEVLARLPALGDAAPLRGPDIEFPHADVLDLWDRSLSSHPDRLAVRCGETCLTYRELELRAGQLAGRLMQQGVGPERRVAVLAERSCEFVLGVLAVLKAGGAYVPLDPQLPVERLQYQLADSEARWLLAAQPPAWAAGMPVLPLMLTGDAIEVVAQRRQPLPSQAAYLIYTSGSTGRPKGVVISRGALAHYVQAVLHKLDLADDAVNVAMVSTVAADLGHTSLFGALCSGRTLHLIDAGLAFDPDGFAACMKDRRIDVLKIVPSHLQALLAAAGPADVLPARQLVVGGEATGWPLLDRIARLHPGLRVLNHYGPTETTVGILTQDAHAASRSAATLPVGKPLPNSEAHVLDEYLNPVPAGVAGELYLAGAGVARGYQGQAMQTAERFVACPGGHGDRMYRTGDRVRALADGSLEFLGRVDDQVKVRGYRVELREVAQALRGQPGVAEAEVLVRQAEDGRQELHGYVVPRSGESVEPGALRQALTRVLPEYMVPNALTALAALPLTANGKVDRKALPLPQRAAAGDGYEAPSDEAEQVLAQVWAQVLRLERVGRQDNFFDLGGDSILALQIVARARRLGMRFTPLQLMERQTIAAVAALATLEAPRAPAVAPVPQQRANDAAPTPVQAWFFEQEFESSHHWNQSLLLSPTELVDVSRLQQAVQAVEVHHEALRMGFRRGADGRWSQAAEPGGRPVFERVDLSAEPDLSAAITRAADVAQGDLALDRPFKAVWMELGAGRGGRLLLIAHHLVVDGVSWRIILEDLQTAYQRLGQGRCAAALDLPRATTPYSDWSAALVRHAASDGLRAEMPYWQGIAAQAEPSLPGNAAGSNTVADASTLSTVLDEAHTDQLLHDAPQAYRARIDDLLLTALARTLCDWDGRDSVLVELESHGREEHLFDGVDLSRSVGWFTSLYPVRLTPGAKGADLGASLKAVKELLRGVPNKGLGYGVLRYLSTEGLKNAIHAAAQVTFNYLGQIDRGIEAAGTWRLAREGAGLERAPTSRRRAWLSVDADIYRGELRVRWTYSAAVHEPATVQGLAQRFLRELQDLAEHCSGGAHGVTPSDFPLADVTQAQLDLMSVPSKRLADLYPLSPMQSGMLFHTLLDPQGTAYVNQLRLDFEDLEPERFKAAWRQVLERHEVLRSGFVQGEAPLQWVARNVELPMLELDWRENADLPVALDALARTERERGFDLAAPPLMRLVLVRRATRSHHLVWTRHHLLLDGWSTARLMSDLLACYAGQPLAPPRGRYRDYIAWLQGRDGMAAQRYWQALLAPLAQPTRLVDALKPGMGSLGHGEYLQSLSEEETAHLLAYSRAERVTVNTVIQAAWALLLQRYTGQATVCFGATTTGRSADIPDSDEVLGLFINTLPVVARAKPGQGAGEWLRELQAQNLASREHEHTPLFEIQRCARVDGQALFDSIVVFENYPVDEALRAPGESALRVSMAASREETHYPMTVSVHPGRTLDIGYAFQQQCFSPDRVECLAGHLLNLLRAMTQAAPRCLGEIEMLDAHDKARQARWGVNGQRCDHADPVHRLFERQARRRPQAIALLLDGQGVSYDELNRRANRLAYRLIALGLRPDAKVGLLVERSVDMVVGLLAVLKAGGAYVPLDPEYPAYRLAAMAHDSGIGLLLTQSRLLAQVPPGGAWRTLALDALALQDESDSDPDVQVHGESLAYVIYTSGSTGRPKGIGIAHAALAEHSHIAVGLFALTPEDRMLQFSTINFDGFVEQLFAPLAIGATVVLRGPALWDCATFRRELLRQRISIADLPTAYWHMLAQEFARGGSQDYGVLRQVQAMGEAMPPEGVKAWRMAGLAHVRLLNTYGPTETVVTATAHDCAAYLQDEVEPPAPMPIGRPLAGRHCYVLDRTLNLVSQGVAGELFIGGALLGRGYLGRAGLTAERFVADPFEAGGGRLYRTGDLVRWNAQGELEYLGRLDHQVKIRGFRIELGEVEAQLLAQPGVREAVVLAMQGPGGARLAAYVSGDDPQPQVLRERLQQALPDYMVPGVIVVLPGLPLNANGKVDRKALPQPELASESADEPPQGEMELALAQVWTEVLGVPQVSRHHSFFDLGGHSLSALQLVARVQARMQVDLAVRDVFAQPTLLAMARQILVLATVGGVAQSLAAVDSFMDNLEEV
ncbi:amino acid adenylation domain-containing protein [Achromobacter aegrifaciens]